MAFTYIIGILSFILVASTTRFSVALSSSEVSEGRTVYYVERPRVNPSLKWPQMRLLIVTWDSRQEDTNEENEEEIRPKFCKVHVNPEEILKTLQDAEKANAEIEIITTEKLDELLELCPYFSNGFKSNILLSKNAFTLTWPGLKWCGPGDVAEHYEDLGEPAEVDKCCRTHDHCEEVIFEGETKYELYNSGFFSRLHCDCDDQFRTCLQNTRDKTANALGEFYFNVAQIKCFKYEYPAGKCLRWGGFLNLSCQEYELDETKPKQWQWFPPQEYKKLKN